MAEAVRAFWKGHLRLALVTIPIRLVSAQKSESGVSFHQVDRKTKKRIRYQKVVPGHGEVARDDIVMGYEVEPGNYVVFEDEELDSLRLSSRHTIELTQFVEACEIDPLYFERPYYVLPDGEVAEEGYRVIRDALRAARKVGLGQLTLRGRENLVALYPGGGGLVVDTLRYEEEIRDADAIFSGIGAGKPRADMLDMARELIERRTESFDPAKYRNHYAAALKELIAAKLKTGDTVAIGEPQEKGAKVLDFMEALRRSVDGGARAPAASAAESGDDESAPRARSGKSARKSDGSGSDEKSDKRGSKSATKSATKSAAKSAGRGAAKKSAPARQRRSA